MMRRIQRAGCLLMILMLLPAAVYAGTIDDLIGLLTRDAESAVSAEMRAEVVRMPEMGGTRLEWLNRLLGHITFSLRTGDGMQEEIIAVDGSPALGSVSRAGADGTAWQFSFDDETAYRMPEGGDLLSTLSGTTADLSRLDEYSEMAVLLSGFYRFFGGLPELFPEYATLTKINTRYKPYGTAVKKWSITLPEDILQSEKMTAYLDTEGLEAVKEYLSHVVLSGKQRLTLQADENDRLMKVNYTAKAGLSADDLRSVNLDWRCLRGEEGYRDVLQLTTPGPGKRDNLSIDQELVTGAEGNEEYTGTIETDKVADRVRTRTVLTFQLTASGKAVTGNLLEKTYTTGKNESTEVTVSLEQNAQEEYRGSLEIICKLDKIEKEHYRIQLTAGKAEPPQWKDVPEKEMTEDDGRRIAEKAARALLTALIPVPEEDLQYILADLPEGWWARMTTKTDESEETEQP